MKLDYQKTSAAIGHDHSKTCRHRVEIGENGLNYGAYQIDSDGVWLCATGNCPGGAQITIDYEAAYKAMYEVLTIRGDGIQAAVVAAINAALGVVTE